MNFITKINNSNSLDEYIENIHNKCEVTMLNINNSNNNKNNNKINNKINNKNKNVEKITEEYFTIPTPNDYEMIITNNYNVNNLKTIAKFYKLKLSGNKSELIKRIFIHLKLSLSIIKIQKIFRGKIQRNYNKYHGPAFKDRSLCTNKTDFLTIEDVNDLSYSQFFSYRDVDNFIYGFDIISLYNLILKSGKDVKNPYNRNNIPKEVINNIRNLVRVSKLLKIHIDIEIHDVKNDISVQKNIELQILDIFQSIDSLGNYSDPAWFLSLNRFQLSKFVRELQDIWSYRAQLSPETKRNICPPSGDPFRHINVNYIIIEPNMDNIRKYLYPLLDKFVNSGVDKDSKSLGAYYVLGALTLVNEQAAISLPWLFQSVSHF